MQRLSRTPAQGCALASCAACVRSLLPRCLPSPLAQVSLAGYHKGITYCLRTCCL